MTGSTTKEIIKDYMDFLDEIEDYPEGTKRIAIRVYHTALMAASGAIIGALEDMKSFSAGIMAEMMEEREQ